MKAYESRLVDKFESVGVTISVTYDPEWFVWLSSMRHAHKNDRSYGRNFGMDCKCPTIHFKTEADYAYFLLIKDDLI